MTLLDEVDQAKGCARFVGSGRLTIPSLVEAVDRLAEDTRSRSDLAIVLDLRNTEYSAGTGDGDAVMAVMQRMPRKCRNKFALVVPNSIYLMARLYTVLAKSKGFENIECFTDMDKACGWCGLAGYTQTAHPWPDMFANPWE